MTCGMQVASFRLLDPIVGWDAADHKGLAGLGGDDGITLLPLDPGAIGDDALAPYLPPPWIAPGCGPCEWFLAAPASSDLASRDLASRLLHLDGCAGEWREVWPVHCTPLIGADVVALAVSAQRLALADRAAGRVLLATADGARIIADIPCTNITRAGAVALGFDACGALLAAVGTESFLRRFDLAGGSLAPFPARLPTGVLRVAGTPDGAVWVATVGKAIATSHLWRAEQGDAAFTPATLHRLAGARVRNALISATDNIVCLPRTVADGQPVICCWSRFGGLVPPPVIHLASPRYQASGQFLSLAIDSGVPRCVWHRVQLDADIPTGTQLLLAVATAEMADGTPQGENSPEWRDFAAGVPHPLDWQEVTGGADVLIQQQPGRYLYVRLRLQSLDGLATPRVRRIRLDFPRATSIDLLPAIYRADPDAADFTARFLALFDASIDDLDSAIERAPALLDAGGVPDGVLPWLGSFLGLIFDPAWDAARSRAILRAIPELYRLRGTLTGLKLAFRLVFDLDPAIEERGPARPWAALGHCSWLGGIRLFGRNRARARLGRSALGKTVLKSWGDPARDPLDALAWRVQLLLPPAARAYDMARLQALLDSQKPAHVIASLRIGGEGFLIGARSAIGIDTAFLPPPAPVLGRGDSVRLGRASVLRRGRRAARGLPGDFVVGQPLTE